MKRSAWGLAACGAALLLPVIGAAAYPVAEGAIAERDMPFLPPGGAHVLGTDDIGGDVWLQLLVGARTSLTIGIGSATGSLIIGFAISFFGVHAGRLSDLIWRLVDIWASLPRVAVLILVAGLTRPSTLNVIIALSLLNWPLPARVVKPSMENLSNSDLYRSHRVLGGNSYTFWTHHGMPLLFPLLASLFVLEARIAILAEAGLAFLGLRDPSTPTWGGMIARAMDHHLTWIGGAWKWVVLPPAAALVAVTLGLALTSWALESALQPQAARWATGQPAAAARVGVR